MSNQPLPPNIFSVNIYLSAHARIISLLLCTCTYYFSPVYLILSVIEVTPNHSRTISFLILSYLVCPHIHLDIFISDTYIFWICYYICLFSSKNQRKDLKICAFLQCKLIAKSTIAATTFLAITTELWHITHVTWKVLWYYNNL